MSSGVFDPYHSLPSREHSCPSTADRTAALCESCDRVMTARYPIPMGIRATSAHRFESTVLRARSGRYPPWLRADSGPACRSRFRLASQSIGNINTLFSLFHQVRKRICGAVRPTRNLYLTPPTAPVYPYFVGSVLCLASHIL